MRTFQRVLGTAAVALLVLSATAVRPASAQTGLLYLQIKEYFLYDRAQLATMGVDVTYATSQTTCFNAGGVPIADTNSVIDASIANLLIRKGQLADGLSIFTGASAKPSAANPNDCVDLTKTGTANSANCYYRWRFGFYDMYSYKGEPGTAYWTGLYIIDWQNPAPQVLNSFTEFTWNTTTNYPRGHYNVIVGMNADAALLIRMDSPEVPVNNAPNPVDEYIVMCEIQLYPMFPYTTSKMPQPQFVQGWKSLTWPQEHWWVLYIIIAVIILALLIAIIVFCCVHSRNEPVKGEPILNMVERERDGRAYVVQYDEQDPEKEEEEHYADPTSNPNPLYPSPQEEQRQRALRYGKGFTVGDPEDEVRHNAMIYSAADQRQRTDGDSIASDFADRKDDEDLMDGMLGGARNMQENARAPPPPPPPPAPEPVPEPEPAQPQRPPSPVAEPLDFQPKEEMQSFTGEGIDETSRAPSIKSRRSARRGRGRTTSQTFSEIEVPTGGEISEANVDL